MLRVWNVTLVIITFFLTIFGTFMTRSGVVQSVHAFGEDRELARLFTIFMIVIVTFSFGLVIYRLPLLRSRNELDSWVSREAAFLANNWILLFSAFFVLFATMFPTLSEAVTGERLTVGPPFFNKWMLPIGLVAARADRRRAAARVAQVDDRRTCVDQFLWPVVFAFVVGRRAGRARRPRLELGHLLRAVRVRLRHDHAGVHPRRARCAARRPAPTSLTAMIGLVGRSKRRYGGYIVHVGIVLMFLGFAGEGFKQEERGAAQAGRAGHGRRTSRSGTTRCASPATTQKQMITGHVTRARRRQADRHDGAGEVVLRQARTGADDRGRDPPRRRRGPLHRARRLRAGRAERDLRRDRQSAGQLDLARLRHHGARHRPRAAAGDARSRSPRPRCRRAPRPRRCCCCCCWCRRSWRRADARCDAGRSCASSSKGRSSARAAAGGR